MGMVIASLGWPPGPLFPPSSLSLPFSDGVECAGAPPPPAGGCTDAAAEPGLAWNAAGSGVWEEPGGGGKLGGGKLGGGIEGSMVGRPSAGAGPGMSVWCWCCIGSTAGGSSSMGANLATEAEAEASLFRDGMVREWGAIRAAENGSKSGSDGAGTRGEGVVQVAQ